MSVVEASILEPFKPLLSPARFKGAYGGRGSGKSRFFATLAVVQALAGKKIVCIREYQKSLKYSSKQLITAEINHLKTRQQFTITKDEIRSESGGLIIFIGMQDHTADSIKSLADFDIAWVEEAQNLSHFSLELLRPTIRAVGSELWFSWNPRNKGDAVEFLRHNTPADSIVIQVNHDDIPAKYWPPELETERAYDEQHNPYRYHHIWDGHYEPSATGAIFTPSIVDRNRVDAPPQDLRRIVVGVDPAATSMMEDGKNPNATGIVVCGLGRDGLGYVLQDMSVHGKPEEWARTVIAAYDLWNADNVIAEVNQGGEMVTSVLRAVRKTLPVKAVHASRGKHVRAEPVSALFSTDQIKMCGQFPKLESELYQITPEGYKGQGSPDRADAMVWAVTELMPSIGHAERRRNNRVAYAGTSFKVLN